MRLNEQSLFTSLLVWVSVSAALIAFCTVLTLLVHVGFVVLLAILAVAELYMLIKQDGHAELELKEARHELEGTRIAMQQAAAERDDALKRTTHDATYLKMAEEELWLWIEWAHKAGYSSRELEWMIKENRPPFMPELMLYSYHARACLKEEADEQSEETD